MKVALFGGTGFVGTYITDELLHNNNHPILLVRPGSENKVSRANDCTVNIGDISDKEIIENTPGTGSARAQGRPWPGVAGAGEGAGARLGAGKWTRGSEREAQSGPAGRA